MDILSIVLFLLPVLLAFVVLWYLDTALIRRFDNSFITGLIEVCVALFIVAIGEGVILYFLFDQEQ